MDEGKILVAENGGLYVMKFTGDVRVTLCSTIDHFLDKMFGADDYQRVLIDLTETLGIDSTSLGLLAKLAIESKKINGSIPSIVSTNESITRLLTSMGFEDVFDIVTTAVPENENELGELQVEQCAEQEARCSVIEAHKILMELNDSNRAAFKELVDLLEKTNEQ